MNAKIIRDLNESVITTARNESARALKESKSIVELQKMNFSKEQCTEIVNLISSIAASVSHTMIKQYIIDSSK